MVRSSIDAAEGKRYSYTYGVEKTPEFPRFIPFPLISHIAWITRESTRAHTYSTPSIDLNISLRLCLAASRFVISNKEKAVLPNGIMSWNTLPANWKKAVDENRVQTLIQEWDRLGYARLDLRDL